MNDIVDCPSLLLKGYLRMSWAGLPMLLPALPMCLAVLSMSLAALPMPRAPLPTSLAEGISRL